jgi:glycosyltransferase involved in cell wall biosynthesis
VARVMGVSPKVSVFLPSYNKGRYVYDAINSVLAQTRPDWELWILENSNDGVTTAMVEQFIEVLPERERAKIHYERLEGEEIEARRRDSYITAWLLNVYYPEASGEYVFYLSDDDLIDRDCLEIMAGELDSNPDYQVVYAGIRIAAATGPGDSGPWPDAGIPARDIKSFPGQADCKMDGGQVMHRKSCLDSLVYPYFEETPEGHIANHCDGIFLERLVGRFAFYPVNRYLITHRRTPLSLWTRSGYAAS